MKKLHTLILSLLVVGTASAQTWKLDKNHAKLGFTVTHLLMSDVDGAFNSFDMKVTASKDDFTDAVIELTADVKTINTNQEGRDKDLRSAKYFNADTFPTITFKSKSLTKVEGQKYKLAGDLTIHGVTKPVTLDVVLKPVAIHPFSKKPFTGFKVSGTIKRKDFHVGDGTPEAIVSDEVIIAAAGEIGKE